MPSLLSIPLFSSIDEYNFKIGIPPPRYSDLDVRDFEDNMKTVRLKMSPFRISFYQISLLESGSGEVGANGQKYDLSRFTLFCNQPNQILYWDVSPDWKGYYISVDESFYTVRLDGFNQLFDLPFFKGYRPGIHLQKDEAEMMLGIISKIHQEYTSPTPYSIPIMKSLLNTIFSYSIRFHQRAYTDQIAKNSLDTLGNRFKEAVHHYLSGRILNVGGATKSISDYADGLNVTLGHLSETIKKELGQTPTDYINEQVIKESQKLLRSTNLQIKEIAYLTGFKDTSYFGRLFKKRIGQTPAQYRTKAL
ncbi:MAG: helix-turn-helix transcriptional regulator [Bacteroidota bacterium]